MSHLPNLTTNSTAASDHSAALDHLTTRFKELPDNDAVISYRTSTVQALTATLKPVQHDMELSLRVGVVRFEFASYIAESIGTSETLTSEGFDFILEGFLKEQFNSNSPTYSKLTAEEKASVESCIRSQQELYQDTFSGLVYSLSDGHSLTPLDGMHNFSSGPTNIDEAYQCYMHFITDEKFASLLEGRPEKEVLNAFKIARAAAGVVETPDSMKAFGELENWLGSAA